MCPATFLSVPIYITMMTMHKCIVHKTPFCTHGKCVTPLWVRAASFRREPPHRPGPWPSLPLDFGTPGEVLLPCVAKKQKQNMSAEQKKVFLKP